jgi:hypothetical protein
MTTMVELPKSTGYKSAVRAYAAARKLNVVAAAFMYIGIVVGLGGIAGCIVVICTANTPDAKWISAALIVGAVFWILGVVLAGTWAQTYARHVMSQAPWEPK